MILLLPLSWMSGSSSSSPRMAASSSSVTSTSSTCSPASCPALPCAVLLAVVAAHRIADVAVALTDAALLLVAEAKARDVDLRNGDRDEVLALSSDQLALRDVLAEVLPDLAADDVPKARMILIDLEAHRQKLQSSTSLQVSRWQNDRPHRGRCDRACVALRADKRVRAEWASE